MAKLDNSSALLPPPFDIADAKAIQMLVAGEATPAHQKRAIDWIIRVAAATYDQPFRPGDSSRETDFACGRMFVGQQIVKLMKIDLLSMQKKGENNG